MFDASYDSKSIVRPYSTVRTLTCMPTPLRHLLNVAMLAALSCALTSPLLAQTAPPIELQHRPAPEPAPPAVQLTIPQGAPLEIALDSEIRVRRIGQPVQGRLVEPVYAFDKLVVPAGAPVAGKITQIERISVVHRTESALDADFTPARKIQIEFDEIALPNGTHIPIQSAVTPGSGQLLDFVAAANDANQKKTLKRSAAGRVQQAKQQAHQEWTAVMSQVVGPGKIHRAKRYLLSQSPVHPQYIDAGSIYFAELRAPLNFGAEPLTPEMAQSIGHVSPTGGVVHARLATALTSANGKNGDAVEAVVTQPLFDSGHLIVPEGSVLAGTIVQVRSARRLKRNGELRVAFHQLRLPNGIEQEIEASLESVQAGKSADLKLDSEGGAQATTPKTRYLSTAVALGLAGISAHGDDDAATPNPAGNPANRMAGGAVGYKLVGVALGVLVHSRAFGYSMGAYGAGMSIYSHFISRGRDVVFPKNTAMQIGLGTHEPSPVSSRVSNRNGN